MEEFDSEIKQWLEMGAMTDLITQYGSGSSLRDITLKQLYEYLKNPYGNIKEIQKVSKYLTNKHGVVKEVLRSIKALPTLDYSISFSEVDDEKKLRTYEKKVNKFIKTIDMKQMVRDGLFELGEIGSLVTCLRDKKYVQFLDIDDVRVIKQRNGRWVVEFDLNVIKRTKSAIDKNSIIESLPEEITIARYNEYINKGEDYRYVELKNADILSIDGNRNMPYGLPLTIGAWSALLQKDVIDQVERSVADRLLKNIVVLQAGHFDEKEKKPVPLDILSYYFNQVSGMFKKQNGINDNSSQEQASIATVALPHFLELKTLKVDTSLFPSELYNKVENDIYKGLGVSPSLLSGVGSGTYSTSSVNEEKFIRYIYTILEKFEAIINRYLEQILPKSVECSFRFEQNTVLDIDKHVSRQKELYMQTGVSKYYLEAVTGVPYEDVLAQAKYEKQHLKIEDILSPPQNAYTQSGNSKDVGRPTVDSDNPNTNKSKTNGSNNAPKPSTK